MKPTKITSASCKMIKGIISNSLTRKVLATCFAILVLVSCSQDNGKYHFLTSDEAISSAQSFLTTLRKSPSGDIKRIAEKVGEWQALRDSVFACLCRDTASIPHSSYNQRFRLISDSVRREFVVQAGAKQRTFLDLIYCCPLKLFEHKKNRAGFLAWNSAHLVTFVFANKNM